MYIGVLNTRASGLGGHYCYRRKGARSPFPPDRIFDAAGADAGPIAFGAGSLGRGEPVGWKWDSVTDGCLDVVFDLSEQCFIGAVCLGVAEKSAVGAVEILCGTGGMFPAGRFDARTGGELRGEMTVPVETDARILVVRLRACLTELILTKLDIIGAAGGGPVLYPTPAEVRYLPGELRLGDLRSITGMVGSPDTDFAAGYLRERLRERTGVDLTVSECGDGAVSLEIAPDLPAQGYRISVSAEGIRIASSDRLGLLYGVETLIQLCRGGTISFCEIEDRPYRPMRGFHIGLPPREELEFARRVIRYILIPMHYNIIFLEFAGGMRYDSHPEISRAWLEGNRRAKAGRQPPFPHGDMVAGGELLEKDEVRGFVEYAGSFGLEIIPEVQSISHVQYITYAHPDIAETARPAPAEKADIRYADQSPDVFYAHSYCPSLEKSYKIVFDLIDEIVDLVRPERYVHMGHDEIYEIGICPRCRGKDPAELYARHVTRLHDYLARKGLGMMIWSDMLQPTEKYLTHPAVNKIPRDIILLDFIWYFHFDIDMEDHLLPSGFSVVMGNMYSSHYPRFESRMAKPGMLGGEVSTWCRFDEYNLAINGKIFDLLYSAQMLWSAGYDARAREVYTRFIQDRIPAIRDELRGTAAPGGVPAGSDPIALPCSGSPRLPGPLARFIAGAGDTLAAKRFNLSGAQRLTAEPVEADIGGRYQKLVFLHATTDNAPRVPRQPLPVVGEYTVVYADGSACALQVEYAGNICVWTRRYGRPMHQQCYRHVGYIATYLADPLIQAKTEWGGDITAYGYEWVNPRPDCPISRVSCRGVGDTGADVLLLGISGMK